MQNTTQTSNLNQKSIHTSPLTAGSTVQISTAEVKAALNSWGQGLVKIATAFHEGKDAKSVAMDVIKSAYDYDHAPVLFKPTLAAKTMFRTTFEGALSYFVGGNSQFAEDGGFALNPWAKVEFDLAGIQTHGDVGIAMGNKLLTKKDGTLVIANFTMGFKKYSDQSIKIFIHHSSLPYSPSV